MTPFDAAADSAGAIVEHALAEVLDGRFQTELPDETVEPPAELTLPDWLTLPGDLIGRVLFVTMCVVVGALLVVIVMRVASYAQNRPRRREAAEDALLDGHAGVIAQPLADADALAREGRYADAIHVLLLRTLEELGRRLPAPLSPSLTSREILARVGLPGTARAPLETLVDAVEITHFGGRPPGPDEWHSCREAFGSFAAAYAGRAR